MKKILCFAALAFALVGMASATPGNNGGGNGGCGVGQQTNGCGSTGGSGGAGGTGGAGGAGGTGVGIGIAGAAAQAAANAAAQANAGAAVVGSGNSSNNIKNTNNMAQGQQQGQAQGQSQSARSNATGGASNANSMSGGNSLSGGAVTVSVEGAKGDVYVAPAQERNPVATAYAAPLTSTNGTCMGSSSGGGQGAAIGISFATTWTDNNCDIRYDAEALRAAGLADAARARLCQKPEIKAAMEAAGTPCQDKGSAKRAEAALSGTSVASAEVAKPQYTDPIVRARLGLPPLK
jgi:hypothetical protein